MEAETFSLRGMNAFVARRYVRHDKRSIHLNYRVQWATERFVSHRLGMPFAYPY